MKSFILLFVSVMAVCAQSIASSVVITTSSLPGGTAEATYSATIVAKGGCTPYVWTVSGTLPPGVSSAGGSGRSLSLFGTPTQAGSFPFTVAVKGCGGYTSKLSYTIVIQPEPTHVVNLSWDASSSNNVAGYNMYRGTDGVTWQKVNSGGLIAWTVYSDVSCGNHKNYYYAATAVDISGMESAKSASVQVAIP